MSKRHKFPRTVKVYVEMDLKEGLHFTPSRGDKEARIEAEAAFINLINYYCEDDSIVNYVQSRIVEEPS